MTATLTAMATFATHHWDGPPWPAFFVGPLLFAAVIVAAVLYVRSRRPWGAAGILAERYARGEIDEDEFRRRRDGLQAR